MSKQVKVSLSQYLHITNLQLTAAAAAVVVACSRPSSWWRRRDYGIAPTELSLGFLNVLQRIDIYHARTSVSLQNARIKQNTRKVSMNVFNATIAHKTMCK